MFVSATIHIVLMEAGFTETSSNELNCLISFSTCVPNNFLMKPNWPKKNCLHFHVFIQVIDVECCYIFTMEMEMGNSTMQPPCFRALNKRGYRTTDLILLCYQNCEGFL